MSKTITIIGKSNSLAQRIEEYLLDKKELKFFNNKAEFHVKHLISFNDPGLKLNNSERVFNHRAWLRVNLIIDFRDPSLILKNLRYIFSCGIDVGERFKPRAYIVGSRASAGDVKHLNLLFENIGIAGVILTDEQYQNLMKNDFLLDFILMRAMVISSEGVYKFNDLINEEYTDEEAEENLDKDELDDLDDDSDDDTWSEVGV